MITVIIVVYNASRYLKFAIESVLAQTYKNFEIIAVDDGSTDSTIDILNEYTTLPNFTLVKKEHTMNLGGNRNYAINLSKGEHIAFIDGDDIWEKDKLSIQMEHIYKYDMICSNACLINENNEIFSKWHSKKFDTDGEIKLSDLVCDNFVIVSSVLINKNAVEAAGYFEDGPDTRAEDYVLWLNYLKNNKIKFINKPLLRYRIHKKNWSNSTIIDWMRLLQRTIDIRTEYLKDPDCDVRKSAAKGCISSYLELSRVSFKSGKINDTKKYLKNVLKLYNAKFNLKYLKYSLGYVYISFLCLIKKDTIPE